MMPEAISGFDDFSIEEKIPKRSPIQRAASFFLTFSSKKYLSIIYTSHICTDACEFVLVEQV
jgi:hypothetical protein